MDSRRQDIQASIHAGQLKRSALLVEHRCLQTHTSEQRQTQRQAEQDVLQLECKLRNAKGALRNAVIETAERVNAGAASLASLKLVQDALDADRESLRQFQSGADLLHGRAGPAAVSDQTAMNGAELLEDPTHDAHSRGITGESRSTAFGLRNIASAAIPDSLCKSQATPGTIAAPEQLPPCPGQQNLMSSISRRSSGVRQASSRLPLQDLTASAMVPRPSSPSPDSPSREHTLRETCSGLKVSSHAETSSPAAHLNGTRRRGPDRSSLNIEHENTSVTESAAAQTAKPNASAAGRTRTRRTTTCYEGDYVTAANKGNCSQEQTVRKVRRRPRMVVNKLGRPRIDNAHAGMVPSSRQQPAPLDRVTKQSRPQTLPTNSSAAAPKRGNHYEIAAAAYRAAQPAVPALCLQMSPSGCTVQQGTVDERSCASLPSLKDRLDAMRAASPLLPQPPAGQTAVQPGDQRMLLFQSQHSLDLCPALILLWHIKIHH